MQAVKRNTKRFPPDFMFILTRAEIQDLSQFVMSPKFKHAPNVYAFTEQGVAMLSSVLRSERAILVNSSYAHFCKATPPYKHPQRVIS